MITYFIQYDVITDNFGLHIDKVHLLYNSFCHRTSHDNLSGIINADRKVTFLDSAFVYLCQQRISGA